MMIVSILAVLTTANQTVVKTTSHCSILGCPGGERGPTAHTCKEREKVRRQGVAVNRSEGKTHTHTTIIFFSTG